MAARSVLVLGAGGMLGRAVAGAWRRRAPERLIELARKDLDVTDKHAVHNAVRKYETDLVVNCAAFTDVDGCERNPMLAAAVNADAAGTVAEECKAVGAFLVHVSTDFVFDGKASEPYRETDAAEPLSVYGSTKLAGERNIERLRGRHLIVRTAWTYGDGHENFVSKVLARARRDGKLGILAGQRGSPSWVEDVADGLVTLAAAGQRGVFHVVNDGVADRIELARAVLELSGLGTVPVEPLDAPPAADGPVAARPAFSVLSCAKYAGVAGGPLRPWRDALTAYLAPTSAGS